MFRIFSFWSFEFVSNFESRASNLNLRLGALSVLGASDIRGSCPKKFALRRVIVVLRAWPLGLSPCPRVASEMAPLERHR